MINFNKKTTIQITLDSFTEGKVTAGETWNDSAYDVIEIGAELTYFLDGCKYSVKGDVNSSKEDCINLLKDNIPQIIFDEWFEENWTKEFSDFGLDAPTVYDFEEGETNTVKSIDDFVNNCSFDDCYDEVIEQLKEVASKEYEVEIDGVVVSASKESSYSSNFESFEVHFKVYDNQNPSVYFEGYVEINDDEAEDVDWYYWNGSGYQSTHYYHHNNESIKGLTDEQNQEIDLFYVKYIEDALWIENTILQSKADENRTYVRKDCTLIINEGAKFEVETDDVNLNEDREDFE